MTSDAILVVNEPFVPDFCRTQRWAARTRARVLRAPDWLAYATAVLAKDGFHVELHDFPAMGWDKPELETLARDKQPFMAVLDSTTPSFSSDVDCARRIKAQSPDTKILMVGPHVSALPEDSLVAAAGAVDAVAIGEYDYTVRDVARCWRDDAADLSGVAGIAWVKDGAPTRTSARPLIADLDALPFPAWDQLDLMRYYDGSKLHPYVTIIGGRGCPFGCSFCLWPQVMHGRKYRTRSPENIVEEMRWVVANWPQVRQGEFFFEDDTFTVNADRAHALCEAIEKSGLGVPFSINSRADVSDMALLRHLKRAGCRMVLTGFESGSQTMLDRMGKKTTVAQMERFVRACREAGLAVHGCFVLGLPGETRQTMRETLDFSLRVPLTTLQFSAAVPFPGTRYFEEIKAQGLLLAKSWDDWLQDGEQSPVVEYPDLGADEVEAAVDKGLRQFYFRPSYMLRFLLATRSKSDLYRKLRGFFNFLGYLVSSRRKKACRDR